MLRSIIMKLKFVLLNVKTGFKENHRTRKEIVDILDIPYRQARSLYLAGDKQYSHPKIKELYSKYRIL